MSDSIEILEVSKTGVRFRINDRPSSNESWVGIYPKGADNQDLGEGEERASRWRWLRDIDTNNASFPFFYRHRDTEFEWAGSGDYEIRVFSDGELSLIHI